MQTTIVKATTSIAVVEREITAAERYCRRNHSDDGWQLQSPEFPLIVHAFPCPCRLDYDGIPIALLKERGKRAPLRDRRASIDQKD